MDQLIIKNLELFAYHGVNSEEKAMGQKFIIDVTLDMDLSKAGATDSLESSINYAELCHDLQKVFTNRVYDLIERAATLLCEHILVSYPQVQKVDLQLKKPWAPIHLPIEYPAIRLIRQWHSAFIGLGSNMGDKENYINTAIEKMHKHDSIRVETISSLIETEPYGNVSQDNFLNGVCKIKTLLSPAQLMELLLDIEKDLDREREIKWGPRTIDLDILYYDSIITDHPSYIIPHPDMIHRDFVLKPLCEIAPYYVHPLLRKRNIELLKDLS